MTEQLPPREDLLAYFDTEERRMSPDAAEGRSFGLDGPIMRIEFSATGVIRAPNDLGLDGPQLGALIERQVQHFAELGKPVEWKTYADDRPGSLIPLLLAAGFEPRSAEAVMVAPTAPTPSREPGGIRIRDALDRDLAEVAALLEAIWGADHQWVVREFGVLRARFGDGFRVLVATADDRIVSVAWLVMRPGTRFAGLWGGSTHPDFRGRGIYRALVSARARLARDRGYPFLRVDASSMSRPVLDALGFVQLTTTTPYVWSP